MTRVTDNLFIYALNPNIAIQNEREQSVACDER